MKLNRILFLPFILLLFISSDTKQPATVSFHFNGQTFNLSGLSDTTGKFYQHHWPSMHTPETFAKNNRQNPDRICGRFVSADMDTMIELMIRWPYGLDVKEEDILKLKNDTVWTLNSSKGKRGNYNQSGNFYTGKSFDMMYFNKDREYLSDIAPLGFICFNEIKRVSGKIYSGSGTFECNVHGTDYKSKRITKGKFNLEFYIGL
jgi:hypothetical protein